MAFRKKIGEELKFIAGKISEDTTEREKSYYLSGVASLMNRIFNLEFSKELVVLHFLFQAMHGILDQLILKIEQRAEKTIIIPEDFFPQLSKLLQELALDIEKKKDLYEIVQKIATFSYVLTGNGYYLYKRNVLSLS